MQIFRILRMILLKNGSFEWSRFFKLIWTTAATGTALKLTESALLFIFVIIGFEHYVCFTFGSLLHLSEFLFYFNRFFFHFQLLDSRVFLFSVPEMLWQLYVLKTLKVFLFLLNCCWVIYLFQLLVYLFISQIIAFLLIAIIIFI